MRDFDFTIKAGSGSYSNLDKEYNKFLNEILKKVDECKLHRWETYNLIMEEFINSGFDNIFEEIKYRLTDGEDPNEIMLDVINRENNISGLIWQLKRRIEHYKEEDFYERFC